MKLDEGSRIGPYVIDGVIGSGGMGEVFRGRDTRLNRTVAIKVLHAQANADADERRRFLRESQAVAALQHPHICVLYDVGEQAGLDYLVLEFLDGETLAARSGRRMASGSCRPGHDRIAGSRSGNGWIRAALATK